MDDSRLVEVRLLGVPLRLRERSSQHGEELLRELALVHIGADRTTVPALPARLLDLATEVQETYGSASAGPNDELDRAFERGEEIADVTYTVPRHIVAFVHRLTDVLEDAERYCLEGEHLLTLAPPADIVAYRRWVLGEFERQATGVDALPWVADA